MRIYEKVALLQMIRRLHVSTLAKTDLAPSIAFAIILCAVIPFTSTISAASTGKEQDQASAVVQIRSLFRAQQGAWNRGDIDGFMTGYARSGSTVFISDDEVRRGWETVRERYKRKYPDRTKMGMLTFSDLEITPLCVDAAVVLGRWQLKRPTDNPHGRFTLIFRRLPEGWRIVLDHTSATPPPTR
jgi:ketosteroid isomerase-like protein